MSRHRSRTNDTTTGQVRPPTAGVSRRAFMGSAAGGAALLVLSGLWWRRRAAVSVLDGLADVGTVTVYKSPYCECCGKWIDHMRRSGFTVVARDMTDVTPVKRDFGVPDGLYSCHTAELGDYVFEGHVPADLVARVLRELPGIRGLAVPGMPQSAPGMDIGRQRYEIIAFKATGETSVYEVRSS